MIFPRKLTAGIHYRKCKGCHALNLNGLTLAKLTDFSVVYELHCWLILTGFFWRNNPYTQCRDRGSYCGVQKSPIRNLSESLLLGKQKNVMFFLIEGFYIFRLVKSVQCPTIRLFCREGHHRCNPWQSVPSRQGFKRSQANKIEYRVEVMEQQT